MTTESWSIISVLAAVCSAVTAVFTVIWVKATVKATKDAGKQQSYLTITQLLSLDKERRADRDLLCRQAPGDWMNWQEDAKGAARRFCALLNIATVFDSKDILPRGLLFEQYYIVLARAWHHASSWLEHERQSMPQLYEDFVRIAQKAKDKCTQQKISIENLAADAGQKEMKSP
jgi:hypothetical protein